MDGDGKSEGSLHLLIIQDNSLLGFLSIQFATFNQIWCIMFGNTRFKCHFKFHMPNDCKQHLLVARLFQVNCEVPYRNKQFAIPNRPRVQSLEEGFTALGIG